ncbi:MAG: ribokinase [Solirubrobacterales bacterium]|nr:ribokinase [Solirubrobacterales bacterium]
MNPSGAPRIVVVGSVMVDLIAYADPLPAVGQTVVGSAFHIGCGGKGANQAVTARRLGADVVFVGRVGGDVFGEMSIENFREQGVDASRVQALEGESTGVAPIWVEADGSNRIIIVPGANDSLSAQDAVAELDELTEADCLVCQLEVPLATVAAALAVGARLGATKILNPAPATPECVSLFGAADWVVPNEHEFALLWGTEPTDEAILAAAAAWGCGLIVTLGAEGAAATVGGEVVRSRPPSVVVADTTGAGDAFVGGLAYALGLGLTIAAAIDFGNRCGALSTQALGTQTSFPTREALERASDLQPL